MSEEVSEETEELREELLHRYLGPYGIGAPMSEMKREKILRSLLWERGYLLKKSRSRNSNSLKFGRFAIVEDQEYWGSGKAEKPDFICTLEEVENFIIEMNIEDPDELERFNLELQARGKVECLLTLSQYGFI